MNNRLKEQPVYKIGQEVTVEMTTKDEASGLSFSNMIVALISEIKASGTSVRDTYEYGITLDMPGCYHNGKPPFKWIFEEEIVLAERKGE